MSLYGHYSTLRAPEEDVVVCESVSSLFVPRPRSSAGRWSMQNCLSGSPKLQL